MEELEAEMARVKLQSTRLHQLCITKAGLTARYAEMYRAPIEPLSRSYPATLHMIQAYPSKYNYEEYHFLSQPTLECLFGVELARAMVREYELIQWRDPSIPASQPGQPGPSSTPAAQPSAAQPNPSGTSATQRAQGVNTSRWSNVAGRIPRQEQPASTKKLSRYMTPEKDTKQGPEPEYPQWGYRRFTKQAGSSAYTTRNGEPGHGKININLLSNGHPEVHRARQCGDACFCFDFLVHGKCDKGTLCYNRHVPPTNFERPSIKWDNPVLLAHMDAIESKRKVKNFRSRLFPDMDTASQWIPGYAEQFPPPVRAPKEEVDEWYGAEE